MIKHIVITITIIFSHLVFYSAGYYLPEERYFTLACNTHIKHKVAILSRLTFLAEVYTAGPTLTKLIIQL